MTRDRNECCRQRAVVRVLRDTLDELPVDLEHVKVEVLEISDCRVPCAKIVKRKADPLILQVHHEVAHQLRHHHGRAFRDLQNQAFAQRLVAVEEIVTRESEAELKSSAVPNTVDKGQVLQPMASYPSTATPASLLFLVGCLSLLLAGVTRLMPAR